MTSTVCGWICYLGKWLRNFIIFLWLEGFPVGFAIAWKAGEPNTGCSSPEEPWWYDLLWRQGGWINHSTHSAGDLPWNYPGSIFSLLKYRGEKGFLDLKTIQLSCTVNLIKPLNQKKGVQPRKISMHQTFFMWNKKSECYRHWEISFLRINVADY